MKKSYYKIAFSSAFGNQVYVIETYSVDDAKRAFYFHMQPINKIIEEPRKTTKKIVDGVKPQIGNYYTFPL